MLIQRLSIRLALWMVLATVIMQGLHAVYRISVDVPKAKAEGIEDIRSLVNSLNPAFSESLYQYNDELTERLLKTFASYPAIRSATLFDDDKKLSAQWFRNANPEKTSNFDKNHYMFESKLIYGELPIGSLQVEIELSPIIAKAEETIFSEIWFSTLMGFVTLVLLYFVAQSQVTLPISKLADTVTRLDTQALKAEEIESLDGIRANAEIDLLRKVIKKILMELSQNLNENKQTNAKLKEFADQLEEKVKIRTDELAVAKDNAVKANNAKTDFMNTMTHELRTPLNSILGFSSILKEKELPERLARLVNNIHGSGNQLLTLVTDIINYVDLESKSLKVQMFSVYDVVHGVYLEFNKEAMNKSLKLIMKVDESLILTGDPQRLSMVLRQLVGNAIKFTDEGVVDVSAYKCADGQSCIIVKDTGVGIDLSRIEELSQSFVQLEQGLNRKNEGVGLGLAIVSRVCKRWGAELVFSHLEPQGTQVVLTLPDLEIKKGG